MYNLLNRLYFVSLSFLVHEILSRNYSPIIRDVFDLLFIVYWVIIVKNEKLIKHCPKDAQRVLSVMNIYKHFINNSNYMKPIVSAQRTAQRTITFAFILNNPIPETVPLN